MEIEILMIIEKIKQFSATFDICNILFENRFDLVVLGGYDGGLCFRSQSNRCSEQPVDLIMFIVSC